MVTSPTGRGIPVFEFLALSERATILDVIVNAFKDGNPRWTEVEAVIIDKDLKEWRTFVKNFRGVTVRLIKLDVLLCTDATRCVGVFMSVPRRSCDPACSGRSSLCVAERRA